MSFFILSFDLGLEIEIFQKPGQQNDSEIC